MKVVANKNDAKKRRRDESQDTLAESHKKAKVHAQRKFAQGAAYNSPSIAVIKDKVRPPSNVNTPGLVLSAKRPNTEDFLTFLCFRRTSILPPKLDFFKNAFKEQFIASNHVQKTPNSAGTNKNHTFESVLKSTSRKSDKNEIQKKVQTPVQALRRKYQEQRLAKQNPANLTKLARKVKGKNMIRTRSSTLQEEKVKPTKELILLNDGKEALSGLRSGLQRAPPATSKYLKKSVKVVEMKNLRSRVKDKIIKDKLPVKQSFEKKSSRASSRETPPKKSESARNVKSPEIPSKTGDTKVNVKKLEGLSDFSSDDNEPLLAVKKGKPIVKSKKLANGIKETPRPNSVKTRSQNSEIPTLNINTSIRPTRKTKEAAAIYMEMITKKLVSPEKSGDDDRSSVDSFPELPNARRNEQRESEIKARAMALKKGTSRECGASLKSESKDRRSSILLNRKRDLGKKDSGSAGKSETMKKIIKENQPKKVLTKRITREQPKKISKAPVSKKQTKEDTIKKAPKNEPPKKSLKEEVKSRIVREETSKKLVKDEKKKAKEEYTKKEEIPKKIVREESTKKVQEESKKKILRDEKIKKEEDSWNRNVKEDHSKTSDDSSRKNLKEEPGRKGSQEETTKKVVQEVLLEEVVKKISKEEPVRKSAKEESVRKTHQEDVAKKVTKDELPKKNVKDETSKKGPVEDLFKKTLEETIKRNVKESEFDEPLKKIMKAEPTKKLQQDEIPKKSVREVQEDTTKDQVLVNTETIGKESCDEVPKKLKKVWNEDLSRKTCKGVKEENEKMITDEVELAEAAKNDDSASCDETKKIISQDNSKLKQEKARQVQKVELTEDDHESGEKMNQRERGSTSKTDTEWKNLSKDREVKEETLKNITDALQKKVEVKEAKGTEKEEMSPKRIGEDDSVDSRSTEETEVRPSTRGRKQEESETKTKKVADRANATKRSNSLPKKGCIARSSTPSSNWLPPPGSSSNLVEAPTFYPTEKEFQDPLEFFERIRPAAESFGLCRIVPPSTFKPDCKVSDDMRFTAYNQYVHRMFHRWGPNIKEMMAIKKYLATQSISLKQPPWIGGIEVDLPRLYQSVQNCGGLMKVMEKKKWNQVADIMRIPKAAQDRVTKLDDIYCKYLLPYDTLSQDERQKLFDEVECDWLKRQENTNDSGDEESEEEFYIDECEECIVKGRNMALNQFYRIARNTMSMWFKTQEPAPYEVENEFWRHVSERNSHVCVHSGSIDSSGWGYGFPVAKNNTFSRHPWNLKVLTNNSGSVLRSLGPVMGVTVPTLHVGMVFTAFCWYRDPHGLPWVEYLHTGAPKIWYGISDDNSSVFKEALTKLLPRYIKNKKIWLPSDTAMVPPALLVEQGVSLCHTIQKPGQFILVFPRAFTSSICTGYLVSESVYFAQPSWLSTAEQVFRDIQDCCEPTMFSLEKLLFSIATDTRSSVEVLKQVLPMVWHIKQNEIDGRKTLLNLGLKLSERLPIRDQGGSKKKKGRWIQDGEGDYECEVCRTNLCVSLVINSQEETVLCLPHAIELLTQKRHQLKYCKLMYSYTQEELCELVEKLEQRIESKSHKKMQNKSTCSSK